MGGSIYSAGDTLLVRNQTNKQRNKQTKLLKVLGWVDFVVLVGNRYVVFAVKFVRVTTVMRTPVIISEEGECFKCTRGC